MDNNNISSNKRIAKNTILLYLRMLVMMAIGLFTSRVILHALGATDLGINNVIGGLVGMFSFFNGTLASASQRFITFALGKGDFRELRKTFSLSFAFHALLGIFIFLLLETVGLWFLYNKMVIPADRMNAAFWLLQFSAISSLVSVTQVPYDDCIIAHEKMDIYAYFSIFDVVFKLGNTFLVWWYDGDKLILFGLLGLLEGLLMLIIYRTYSIRHFKEAHLEFTWDKVLAKSMLTFSGWNVMGTLAGTLSSQGLSLLMNTFLGPVVNAAMGICGSINGYVMAFVGNFQTASNPQITKDYADGEWERMNSLVYNTAKFSGYIVLYLAIPIIINIHLILKLWLGYGIPQYTAEFTQIILVQNVIFTMSRPLVTEMHAIGKLKVPSLGNGTVLLLILPVSYILLRLGFSPIVVYVANVLPWIFQLFFENWYVNSQIGTSPYIFIRKVVIVVMLIGVGSFIPSYLISKLMGSEWLALVASSLVSTILLTLLIYKYGMSKHIRAIVVNKIFEKLHIKYRIGVE